MNVSDKYSPQNKILKIEYIERIRLDDELLLKLAKANNVRIRSVERWLASRNKRKGIMLTTATNQTIIAEHFGVLDTKDLLEEEYVKGKMPSEGTKVKENHEPA